VLELILPAASFTDQKEARSHSTKTTSTSGAIRLISLMTAPAPLPLRAAMNRRFGLCFAKDEQVSLPTPVLPTDVKGWLVGTNNWKVNRLSQA
tara:strand:+ start:2070 stop:2348 length:279 start_codon:yes stop_codon:yes gene_type:complete